MFYFSEDNQIKKNEEKQNIGPINIFQFELPSTDCFEIEKQS